MIDLLKREGNQPVKYLQTDGLRDADCSDDAVPSTQLALVNLDRNEAAVAALPEDAALAERHKLVLDGCYLLLELQRFDEAWDRAQGVFRAAIPAEQWLQAAEACDIMFQADQKESIKALAHGIWIGVTYPVDPELSVALLQHLVEESPDRSDGAAVAAAAASFIVDVRAEGKTREDLKFFTTQMLGEVARRHSKVDEQEIFDFWVERRELNDPGKFLPRLSKVLDVLTNGDWWFDRDELRSRIPE